MSKRFLLLPCLLVLSALAFTACGSGSDAEGKVEETIETAATSTDPANCAMLETRKFMEQTGNEGGKSALKSCEEEAEKEENAESVEISNVEVDGSNATAEVVLSGGNSLEGQALEVALVQEGDQWKLNEVVKFTHFDRTKLVESFEREIEKSGETSSKFATCFIGRLEEASQAEIEGMLFGGNAKAFEEIAEGCP